MVAGKRNDTVPLTRIVVVKGVNELPGMSTTAVSGAAPTVTRVVPTLPLIVAVMSVWPFAIAVTRPPDVTVAIALFADAQVGAGALATVPPAPSSAVAESC